MDPETVAAWLKEWSLTWRIPNLESKISIEISPRLRRSLGRCQPAKGTIRINANLLAEPESLLREVVCHEAAHVAVHLLHGPNVRPHGPEWAQLMRAAGFEPRARIDAALLSKPVRASVQPRVLYQHRCPVCGAARLARRPVHRWRCRACNEAGLEGRLEISTRPFVEVNGW